MHPTVIALCYRKILLVFCWTSALRPILAGLGLPVQPRLPSLRLCEFTLLQEQNTATAEANKYMKIIYLVSARNREGGYWFYGSGDDPEEKS